MSTTDEKFRSEIESEVLRTLIGHLQKRSDVQNIDLMNLAGFCRNCLARWYQAAAERHGMEVSKAEARERIYGMPYEEWKKKHQRETTQEQRAAFEKVMADPDQTT